ncbi:TetR/AcrR family transcriptional regulator [Ruminiclostridium papyrosolvens]|uniref:TetR family transcriptional regulator n=1 Tax=Ruminiclostridium papyrosolvens C7 TaxID=1330534 RepID=U4QZD2_9FIRM|nr:TetR/AcrR family transcriptional regulator [Ruminiclostridium papyrosolvens]EPR10339.1 TetR family transcriptional regulator [Ruminiclostridium papyrosolvens C7]
MNNKMTTRTKQAIASKNKIYKCGENLIRKYGFDAVTVEQIAKNAGVSVGTYYYYYESKMDLLREAFNKADKYFLEEVEGKLTETVCKKRIVEFFDIYADYTLKDGIDVIKKFYTSENKMFIVDGRGMQNVLTNIIRAGQKNNEISNDSDPETLTKMLFVVARGIIFDWCLYDGKTDLKVEMKQIMEIMTKHI